MLKRNARWLLLVVASIWAVPASARGPLPPLYDVRSEPLQGSASPVQLPASMRAWGVVTAMDDRRGVPTFLWASPSLQPPVPAGHTTPADAAWHYAEQYAPWYRLTPEALDTAYVHRVHDTGRGGLVVELRQRVGNLPLFHSSLRVLMTRDLVLVALGGNLHAAARSDLQSSHAFALSGAEAAAEAVADLWGVDVSAGRLAPTGQRAGYTYHPLQPTAATRAAGLAFHRPARVKPVLFPAGHQLVAGYYVEVFATDRDQPTPVLYAYVIAADDGRLLHRRSLTALDYDWRVWVEPTGLHTPLDGPIADYSPHPTGTPDGSFPPFIAPIVVNVNGFNTNPAGDADPWLAPASMVTRGNNAQVHIETTAPDGFSFGDRYGEASAPGEFGATYDTAALPWANSDQHDAAAAMLFYTINWMHDYWYDSGFDEAAGNAQTDNYGRGGEQNDAIQAQVAGRDDEFYNNASMSTPADGEAPFMLTGLWTGRPTLTADGSAIYARSASFGAFSYDLSAELILAEDSSGDVNDACEPITNNVSGRIALIDRGSCTFASKAERAEQAGAVAAIIANHNPGGSAMSMPNEDPPLTITIPVVSVSNDSGNTLKAMLSTATVSATLFKDAEAFQGALDNGVVAHEWGHYIHHRLEACGTSGCGAMSEGFADFLAGHMTIGEGDDPLGTYATGLYSVANRNNSAYYGIRRVPYSADMTKNALTFRHIADGEPLPTSHPLDPTSSPNSEVHNAGEIWATVLHDVYMTLLTETFAPAPRYDFYQARRRMADYLVTGMSLTPPDATFTEQRDAILAAMAAADASDFQLAADAFARRGMGTCAQPPPRWSDDFVGLVESYDNAANMRLLSVDLDDSVDSCDNDGLLDATEVGQVTFTLQNTGTTDLVGASLAVTTTDASVTFPAGMTATFGTIAPFETGQVTLQVALDDSPVGPGSIGLEVQVSHPETCITQVTHVEVRRVNYDENLAVSATDNVESQAFAWTEDHEGYVANIWNRVEDPQDPTNHLIYVPDTASQSDTRLVSPPLEVSDSQPFTLSFRHRFSFEYSNSTFWDGGVIEISTDDGATWHDVNITTSPAYTGQLTDTSGNPLSNRWAYAHDSPSWPDFDTESLDFGLGFAGQTVRVRFRVGTDQAAGGHGWEIDDIAFGGIDNTPFAEVVEDERLCWRPVANAGPDQTVAPGDGVTLDGSGSYDPLGGTLTYRWQQLDGPDVALDASDVEDPTFVAPDVSSAAALTFQLTVESGEGTAADEVVITVDPAAEQPDAGPDAALEPSRRGKACDCGTGGSPDRPPLGLLLLIAAAGLAIRRRR